MSNIKVIPYTGSEAKKFIPEIARLRMEIFREYPFLYIGDYEYETKYLHKFISAKDAIVVVAWNGDEIIGVSTGLPFAFESAEVKKPFVEHGLLPNDYFYYGESVLQKKHRKKGIGHLFYVEREKHVRNLKVFKAICFCTVERDKEDPRRPADFKPLNGFWAKEGFIQHPELTCQIPWQEIDEPSETPKTMVYWIKNL